MTDPDFGTSGFRLSYLSIDLGVGAAAGTPTIQTGIVNKVAVGGMQVYFSKAFETPPTVLLGHWLPNGGNAEFVQYVVSPNATSTDSFELISGDSGYEYFVFWVAFGS